MVLGRYGPKYWFLYTKISSFCHTHQYYYCNTSQSIDTWWVSQYEWIFVHSSHYLGQYHSNNNMLWDWCYNFLTGMVGSSIPVLILPIDTMHLHIYWSVIGSNVALCELRMVTMWMLQSSQCDISRSLPWHSKISMTERNELNFGCRKSRIWRQAILHASILGASRYGGRKFV